MIYTIIISVCRITIVWVRNPLIKKTFQTIYIVVFSIMIIDQTWSKRNIERRYAEYNNSRSNKKPTDSF